MEFIQIGHIKELCGSLNTSIQPTTHCMTKLGIPQKYQPKKTMLNCRRNVPCDPTNLRFVELITTERNSTWNQKPTSSWVTKNSSPFPLLHSSISCLLNFMSRECKYIPNYHFPVCHQIEQPRTSQITISQFAIR